MKILVEIGVQKHFPTKKGVDIFGAAYDTPRLKLGCRRIWQTGLKSPWWNWPLFPNSNPYADTYHSRLSTCDSIFLSPFSDDLRDGEDSSVVCWVVGGLTFIKQKLILSGAESPLEKQFWSHRRRYFGQAAGDRAREQRSQARRIFEGEAAISTTAKWIGMELGESEAHL